VSTGYATTTERSNGQVESEAATRNVVAGALLTLALSLGLLVASLFRADGLGLVWASLALDLVAVTLLVTALRRRRAR
jgi:hypothetical protein